MNDGLPDAALLEIEHRLARALQVAPTPWKPWLETRYGTGGCSFVTFDGDQDNEMYLEVHLGTEQLISPDARLDAIVDFVGNAMDDVQKLVAEVKRLRMSDPGTGGSGAAFLDSAHRARPGRT
jgi:hypothetical protein